MPAQRAADRDVAEMRHDKHASLRCTSVASEATNIPVKPPMVKRLIAEAVEYRVSYEIDACTAGRPVENLDGRGHRDGEAQK